MLLIFIVNMQSCYFERQKSISITNYFQKDLDESNCKLNKILIDRYSEFSNRSVKSWLQDYDVEMYSTHNEGTSAVAAIFFITLKGNVKNFQKLK